MIVYKCIRKSAILYFFENKRQLSVLSGGCADLLIFTCGYVIIKMENNYSEKEKGYAITYYKRKSYRDEG